jgi:hypothetical protein
LDAAIVPVALGVNLSRIIAVLAQFAVKAIVAEDR